MSNAEQQGDSSAWGTVAAVGRNGPTALFDLDNTLINRNRALSEWAAAFCRAHSLGAEAGRYLNDRLRARAHPRMFEQLRQALALDVPASHLWNEYVEGIAAGAVPNPGAVSGLEQLRAAGWTLGILTNGPADIQRAKVERSGLADKVDTIVVSEEIGVRKPERGAFAVAVARCGSPAAHEVWFVGDNPETDIDGARRAGLRTIWVGNGATWPLDLPPGDRTARDVRDAISLLLAGPDRR